MSIENPFDNVPADDEAPEVDAPAVGSVTLDVKPRLVASSEGKVVVTLKGGGGYDSPWIVVHADDVDDALAQVNSKAMIELMRVSQAAAKEFAGQAPVQTASSGARNTGGGQGQSRAPQGAKEAPNGEKRYCEHGEMEYKSGVSKAGNAYALFSCTAPRDQQCKAQYPKK